MLNLLMMAQFFQARSAVWALLNFLLNYIPNAGSILGVMLPALLTLVQFDTLMPFVIITLGLGAVQFTIGNLVKPAFMGKSLNLSSFMIFLSLTFWGLLWGVPGMFLSVPTHGHVGYCLRPVRQSARNSINLVCRWTDRQVGRADFQLKKNTAHRRLLLL